MPPAVLVVAAREEFNEPLQQFRWTCIPGTKLSARVREPTAVTAGFWYESAQQQHNGCEMPPAVLVVVAREESNEPLQPFRWACIPGTKLSTRVREPTTVTAGIC
jgi:hypothetical protein